MSHRAVEFLTEIHKVPRVGDHDDSSRGPGRPVRRPELLQEDLFDVEGRRVNLTLGQA
jgi:hypothetical protein